MATRIPLATRASALNVIYRQVPKIACQGLCTDYCGPVGMSVTEGEVLAGRHGPSIMDRDAPVVMLRVQPDLTCPLLGDDGRCRDYSHRPLICRLWGVVPDLPCPHGCEIIGEPLTEDQSRELLAAARDLTAQTEARPCA